jgi:hypothetical protein
VKAMEFMVNMARNSLESGGRDLFSCTSTEWRLLLTIGRTFGWKPRGATYLSVRGASVPEATVRHDYEPGEPRDDKQVDAEDALAWATSLSEARHSPHLAALVSGEAESTSSAHQRSARGTSAVEAFLPVMDEFIEYAFGGAFSFARADEEVRGTRRRRYAPMNSRRS